VVGCSEASCSKSVEEQNARCCDICAGTVFSFDMHECWLFQFSGFFLLTLSVLDKFLYSSLCVEYPAGNRVEIALSNFK